MTLKSIGREGSYLRVFKPDWSNPLDTRYSKMSDQNRWNPPGEFGALYLNRTLEVAAANARRQHVDRAIGLFDLKPDRRPWLLQVKVLRSRVLDVVTEQSVVSLDLPASYPFATTPERCWPIARRAYARRSLKGIACRSAAECTKDTWLGEELSWFDHSPQLRENGPRRSFAQWYPDAQP